MAVLVLLAMGGARTASLDGEPDPMDSTASVERLVSPPIPSSEIASIRERPGEASTLVPRPIRTGVEPKFVDPVSPLEPQLDDDTREDPDRGEAMPDPIDSPTEDRVAAAPPAELSGPRFSHEGVGLSRTLEPRNSLPLIDGEDDQLLDPKAYQDESSWSVATRQRVVDAEYSVGTAELRVWVEDGLDRVFHAADQDAGRLATNWATNLRVQIARARGMRNEPGDQGRTRDRAMKDLYRVWNRYRVGFLGLAPVAYGRIPNGTIVAARASERRRR